LVAIGYLIAKLLFWDQLQLGLAPLLIGIYFFGAVQLFFIGVLGEYIGAIHTQVHKRPLVVEKERINFGEPVPSASRRPKANASPAGQARKISIVEEGSSEDDIDGEASRRVASGSAK
jgi:hypothetical protein